MTNIIRGNFQSHPFHLVSPSPWPIYTCISLMALTTSFVLMINKFTYVNNFLFLAFVAVIISMSFWWRDVVSEGTYLGDHTLAVQRGLYMGIALFIISEALFFLAIFWTFFHSALAPNIEVGTKWPPMGVSSINPFELPLINTILLLSSGITVTYGHHSLIHAHRNGVLHGLFWTVLIAIFFTYFQSVEYLDSTYTLSDSTFGSCFYFGTGFHGFHVIIGTAFIAVGLWRCLSYQPTENHHLGLESSILYWHFVDVVWLFLFVSIYYWGS
uniref:Cytochrome c oxidase subunit 3 n=1 Tax=Coccocarpia palmicola TaxID=301477 RepID=A0A1V0FW84_9LECA|nr:cytochrome c oxidase subunit III [Coccocarpia palmicola]ARB49953.1 cytochrome c oxidase subunit III [Coccocarpia palmicola]